MVTIINLRLPASWTTILPNDNNFDISANKLNDFLDATDPINWGGLNFINVGTINGGVPGGGHAIEDEGNPLAQQPTLNFTGTGVTASDVGGKTVVDIPTSVTPPHPLLDGAQNLDTFPSSPLPGSLIIGNATPLWDDLLIGAPGFVLTSVGGFPAWQALPPPSSPGHVIEEEGTPLAQQTNMNFTGAGVTASDAGGKTVVDIPGGGFDPFTDIDILNEFWFYDEFFYPDPSTDFPHFEFDRTPVSILNVIGGQIQCNTIASIGDLARINVCSAGLMAIDLTKKWRIVWRNRGVQSDANQAMYFGGGSNVGFPSGPFPFNTLATDNPSIGFRKTGTGNWFTHTFDGTTLREIDTSVVSDTLFHTFDITFDPAGTPTITWKIDGATVDTQTTNLPVGQLRVLATTQTNVSGIKGMVVDSMLVYQER